VEKWLTSADVIEVRAPGDGHLVGQTYEATSAMVDTAIESGLAAQAALNAQAPFERSAILRRVSTLISERRELIATLLSAEAGKPVRDARTEVERAALTFRVAAEESERGGGDVLDLGINKASSGRLGITRRFPTGLVAGITPFNLPVSLSSHKLAPAMAVGCPIVLKIPSNAPLAMLEVAKIIRRGRRPRGIGLDHGDVNSRGRSTRYGRSIQVLSFTGSPAVGWSMKERAGKKRVILELGETPEHWSMSAWTSTGPRRAVRRAPLNTPVRPASASSGYLCTKRSTKSSSSSSSPQPTSW